jgi:hypothetical protein
MKYKGSTTTATIGPVGSSIHARTGSPSRMGYLASKYAPSAKWGPTKMTLSRASAPPGTLNVLRANSFMPRRPHQEFPRISHTAVPHPLSPEVSGRLSFQRTAASVSRKARGGSKQPDPLPLKPRAMASSRTYRPRCRVRFEGEDRLTARLTSLRTDVRQT